MTRTSKCGLSGTKTEQNLQNAARGEALTYTKYQLFSDIAAHDGYEQISRVFDQTANNEKEHAELWLGYLGLLGDTEENLESALSGETYESNTLYPEAARIAAEEGFTELADKFRLTGEVEANHAKTFAKLLDALRDGTLFEGDADTEWVCLNCGCRVKGNMPPEHCPLCSYPKGFFAKAD